MAQAFDEARILKTLTGWGRCMRNAQLCREALANVDGKEMHEIVGGLASKSLATFRSLQAEQAILRGLADVPAAAEATAVGVRLTPQSRRGPL